jgi:hypothetical protein
MEKEMLHVVITEPPAKDDEKFNKWYNEVHIPMLLKIKKLKSVTRYKVAGDPSQAAQYVALYHFKNKADFDAFQNCPEHDAAIQEMKDSWGSKIKIINVAAWETIKEWQN